MGRIKYDRHIFDEIDSCDKAYWLGFIVADGYLHETKNMLRIKLNAKDREHLMKFIGFVGGSPDMLKTEYHSQTGNELSYVSLYSKEIRIALNSLGVRQAKSGSEKVPPIPKRFYKDFLRGVWDGDGFIRKNGSGIGLVGSKELLEFSQKIFYEELGVKPLKIHKHGVIFKIEYRSLETFPRILKYLYFNSETYLDRKYNLV